ncbi:substrate-binding domain-containing protein [Enterovirga sp. CN4-39]|uniref:substrate-binding domain-containing protein n=1 Tax=Enterovirga sp. CN4-39 TaxID=3400910 RepID=UPI003C096E22
MCGRTGLNDRAAQRLQAFRDVLAENGIRFRADRVAECAFEADEGRTRAERWLTRPDRPTAIFCANDILALGALFACQSLGLAVPGDVSIVGFDNLPMTAVVPPGLTTIAVPAEEIGRRSVRLLFDGGALSSPAPRIAVETQLIQRSSVGPAPSTAKLRRSSR